MIKRNQRMLNAINLILDGILIMISYNISLWLRFDVLKGSKNVQFSSPEMVATVLIYSIMLVVVYYVLGMYSSGRLRRKREDGLRVILINGLGTLSFMAMCYVVRMQDFSRLMLVLFWGSFFVLKRKY